MRKTLLLFNIFVAITASAQLPHDAIYMGPKTSCIALTYSQSSWENYWENSLKRNNPNMGTHSTYTYMPMLAVGLAKNLNAIASLPYIKTSTSAGNLLGQQGFQDVSVWLKYRWLRSKGFSLHTALGGSIPVSKYVPDFMPMSIGLQSKTATGRAIANYTHSSGMYLGLHASYTLRSNITIDKDSYQTYEKVVNSDQVAVPNATDAAARLGYIKDGSRIQAEVFVERFACVTGDYIRRNNLPFPTNNMRMTTAGFYAKYQPKNIGVNVRLAKVLAGTNVGQSQTYNLGVLYQINPKIKQ
jgi:hypothetical protein